MIVVVTTMGTFVLFRSLERILTVLLCSHCQGSALAMQVKMHITVEKRRRLKNI